MRIVTPPDMRIVADKNIPLVASAFKALGELVLVETGEFSAATVKDAEILVIRSETRVDNDLLDGSRVRFVGTATIGTDHIDIPYLQSHGIGFASAPGSNANSVKEYILAALLTIAGRMGFAVAGKSLGVVGVGNIGSKVVKLASALGMNVLQNDPPLARTTRSPKFLPLDELMEADVLTLHIPLIREGEDSTVSLFNRGRIKRMKPGSILLNTSRGSVVEADALKDALRSGHLSAAVIDVWEGEPSIDVDLLRLVTLGSAHIAGYSMDGKVNAVRLIRSAIASFLHLSSEWDPAEEMTPPEMPRVVLEGATDPSDVLRKAVRACYDIEHDDQLLRGIVDLPELERPARFRRLRSGYRVRREFANTLVDLSRSPKTATSMLLASGFRVEQ